MTGELSPAYLPRLTDRVQQLLPNAERAEIAAASHLMSEQDPGAVNEAILDFLSRAAPNPPHALQYMSVRSGLGGNG